MTKMQSCLFPMASTTNMISMFNKFEAHFPAPLASRFSMKRSRMVVVSAAAPKKKQFAEEMRMAAMKLHKIGEAKPGEKTPAGLAIAKWKPTLEGFLNFLADTNLVYEVLERIVDTAAFPEYAELKNTGLERSERLGKDLEWFEEQGYAIPQPSNFGIDYVCYLKELSEKDPHAFICHFYMTYFGHTAGGRIIGRKVEEKILKGKELEFYKYEGELPQLLQNVRDKLNKLGEGWSKEEKDRCLDEVEKSFNYGADILRRVLF